MEARVGGRCGWWTWGGGNSRSKACVCQDGGTSRLLPRQDCATTTISTLLQTNKQKQRHLSRSLRRTLVRAAHRVERHLLDWTVAAKLGFLGDGRREGGLTPLLHNNNICICFDSYLIYIHTKKQATLWGGLAGTAGWDAIVFRWNALAEDVLTALPVFVCFARRLIHRSIDCGFFFFPLEPGRQLSHTGW